jgi:hypothetical protein
MNIDISQIAPYLWIVAIVLVVIVAFIIIRFFWQHVLKYIVHGCLSIAGILLLLALLHYVFRIF